jgi:hypothetical protein
MIRNRQAQKGPGPPRVVQVPTTVVVVLRVLDRRRLDQRVGGGLGRRDRVDAISKAQGAVPLARRSAHRGAPSANASTRVSFFASPLGAGRTTMEIA